MVIDDVRKIVLDYAPAEANPDPPLIRRMWRWRSLCGLCFWLAVAGVVCSSFRGLGQAFGPLLALAAIAGALICGTVAIVYMARAARAEVDGWYAARQVVLAVALSAFFLLGVWAVPRLVASDLMKWREIDDLEPSKSPGSDNAQPIQKAGAPRTVEDVVGPWKDPAFNSGLIKRCRRYWSVPVDQLPNEALATYLRQKIALILIAPEARRRLDAKFDDGSEMYDGELAKALQDSGAA